MKPRNEIIKQGEGYRVVCDNAESVQVYDNWEEANDASIGDEDAYAVAETAEEAQELSPITWQ